MKCHTEYNLHVEIITAINQITKGKFTAINQITKGEFTAGTKLLTKMVTTFTVLPERANTLMLLVEDESLIINPFVPRPTPALQAPICHRRRQLRTHLHSRNVA